MIRKLLKTGTRTSRFLAGSLAWRAGERPNGLLAWALVGGLIWFVANLGWDTAWAETFTMGLYLFVVLAAICAIDARFGIIPDSLNLALAAGGLVEYGFVHGPRLYEGILEAVAVLIAGTALRMAYRAMRGYDGFGFGDVKFIAAATLWTGPAGLPGVLLIAVVSALAAILILKAERYEIDGKHAIPFGPHLAVGVWLTWAIGPLQFADFGMS